MKPSFIAKMNKHWEHLPGMRPSEGTTSQNSVLL
jgi:hypothetical protein